MHTHRYITATCDPPLSDNVVNGVNRPVLIEPLHGVLLVLVEGPLYLLHEGLEVTELLQQRLVGQKLDVLGVVEGPAGGAAMVHLLQVLGLVRVDALEDAQPPAEIAMNRLRCHGEKKALNGENT